MFLVRVVCANEIQIRPKLMAAHRELFARLSSDLCVRSLVRAEQNDVLEAGRPAGHYALWPTILCTYACDQFIHFDRSRKKNLRQTNRQTERESKRLFAAAC